MPSAAFIESILRSKFRGDLLVDLLHPAARLALVRVVGLLREKAESQLVQSLDENFHVVPARRMVSAATAAASA